MILDNLLGAHIEQTGKKPKSNYLTLLANWVLIYDLKNSHPDKVTNTEYPILTNRQLFLRNSREITSDKIADINAVNPSNKPSAKKNTIEID